MTLRKNGRCRRGHAMTPENTYVRPNGHTVCKKCSQASWRQYNDRRKQLKERNSERA